LKFLYLEDNFLLQGQLPSELGRLEALKEFFVYDNRLLTGSVPEVYQDLTNLEHFVFERNDLSGSLDTIFCINPFVQDLRGDCLGDPPEIACTCCTSRCTVDGETCETTFEQCAKGNKFSVLTEIGAKFDAYGVRYKR
jgi:hypothetical protein